MNPTSVIKLGGSLLDLPDLPERFDRYLERHPRERPVIVCGGGEVVEQLRKWDRLYAIGDEPCHWIALRALTINALVLERVLPRAVHVEKVDDLARAWSEGLRPLLDPWRFICDVDTRDADPLPRGWSVTSDSIAARMARSLGARELVLLKSVSIPPGLSPTEAAARGAVDPVFPHAARGLEVVLTANLREEPVREVPLAAPGCAR